MSDNFASAAAEILEYAEYSDAVEYAVAEAIKTNSLPAVWAMVDQLATCADPEYQTHRAALADHFGRRLKLGELDRLVRNRQRPATGPAIGMASRSVTDIADDAMRALAAANEREKTLFVRGGKLVEINVNESTQAAVREVNIDSLTLHMDRAAVFEKSGIRQSPHANVARNIMARRSDTWPFPTLKTLTQVPVMRPDGSILDTVGHDKQSGIFYHPHSSISHIPPVPDDPGTDDVAAAVELISDIIADFPFVDEASRANMFGLLLTPVVRAAYRGCTMMAILDAPQQGSGKSLLAEVFCLIATGQAAAMTTFQTNDAELDKLILSRLRAGSPIVCFDNITGVLRSPVLAMALTSETYSSRLLGGSEMLEVPQQSVWIGTGNNIRLGEEMRRRCYQIRIDPRSSRPYEGRKFKIPRLKEYVTENRAMILHALLIIARSWFHAGQPADPKATLQGSFEGWHRTLSGILYHANIPHFLGNLAEFQEEADGETESWVIFLARIHQAFPDEWWTTKRLQDMMSFGQWKEDMPEFLQMADKKGALTMALGNAIKSRAGKRFGPREYFLERSTTKASGNIAQWRVVIGRPDAEEQA